MSDRLNLDPRKIIHVLKRRWRLLGLGSFVAAIVAAAGSLTLPITFSSDAAIMPPISPQSGFSPVAGAGALTMYLSSLDLGPTQSELFLEIFSSRTARLAVIDNLELVRRFGLDHKSDALGRELALRRLDGMIGTAKARSGVVTVRVKTTTRPFPLVRDGEVENTRQLAADIANALVHELREIVRDKSTSRARSARMYIEQKLEETELSMMAEAESLRVFQERHMVISIDDQTRELVTQLAELKSRIMTTDVELEVLRRTMTPDNPEVRRRVGRRTALAARYDELVYGTPPTGGPITPAVPPIAETDRASGGSSRPADTSPALTPDPGYLNGDEVHLPLRDIPGIAQEYAMRLRELKVYEGVFSLLNQLYYEASIEEASDVPLIQVLDDAMPRQKKDAPKRSVLVVLAMFLTFVALSARVLIGEGLDALRAA